MKRFDVIEPTADIGIIAYGKSLHELFENAAYGMFSCLTDALSNVRRKKSVEIKTDGSDYESLLVNWLNELVYLVNVKQLLFNEFKIDALGDFFLTAIAKGEKITKKFKLNFELKAATYHNLKIIKSADGMYQTQIIFDV
jgi:SHS2 domain-containing protein